MKMVAFSDFPIVPVRVEHELTDYESMLEETIAELQREKQVMSDAMDDLRCCGNCQHWDRFNWCAKIGYGNEIRMLRREYCPEWKWIKENCTNTDLLDSPF